MNNTDIILQLLVKSGQLSLAEISKRTGIKPATAESILMRLRGKKIHVAGTAPRPKGKSGKPINLYAAGAAPNQPLVVVDSEVKQIRIQGTLRDVPPRRQDIFAWFGFA